MNLENSFTGLLVVAVALVGRDGRVLMQRRSLSAEHGGLWEFPGGKVEAGETPEFAVVREAAEELGVRIDPGVLQPVGSASGQTAGKAGAQRSLVILLYACTSWEEAPHAHEAEAIAWYAPETISSLSMPPLDYPLAEALCGFLADKAI
jgi:8-oxo-dGTP diphosphatase